MKRVSPEEFGDVLCALGTRLPGAMETAMREVGSELAGRLVQREIKDTDPQPVDQGQYKAAWQSTPVEGGAIVGNTSLHSVWIERGRGPGPVPLQPIIEWVDRKGLWRDELDAVKAAAKAAGGQKRDTKGKFRGYGVRKAEIIKGIALKIRAKIASRGIAPRWVLRRAIGKLHIPVGRAVRAALKGLNP